MSTQSSHIRSIHNDDSPRESSSNSNNQLDDDTETESFLDATRADALHNRPNSEENTHIYDGGPSNLSHVSNRSRDRTSSVTGAVSSTGIIQHSDASDDIRTVESRPIDYPRDSENGSNREGLYTIAPSHSIREPLPESDGIHQDIPRTSVETRRPWTPFFLQAYTILSFIVANALLLVTLIILGILDTRNQGLATVGVDIRYVWSYGPTAVLTTLAGLWSQVEYRTKQMMPWAVLRKGPISAADALLLNYVEPPQPVSLCTSAKNGHYAVTLAIAGSLLIQLLTFISTGLLMPQVERIHHHGVAIQATEAFNETFRLNSKSTDSSIGISPILSTIALNNGNLSYPSGTSDRLAFSTLHVQDKFPEAKNMSIETTTEVFHAELDCEIATNFRWNNAYIGENNPVVTFTTPSCHVENLALGAIVNSQTKGVFGGSNFAKCDNSSSSRRFVVVLTDYTRGLNQSLTIDNTSLLLCEPSYVIEPWSLTVNGTGTLANEGSKSLLGSTKSSSLSLSQWDCLDAFLQSIDNNAGTALGPVAYARGYSDTLDSVDSFLNALVAFSMPLSITDLLDANVLLNETTRFFIMASAQLARTYFMVPSSKVLSGTVSTDEKRLRIRGLSLYLMTAILSFLIANTALLCFLCPRNTVSRDPGSVGGLAVMMTESPSFCDVLSGKSLWSKSRLHSYLSKYQALSVIEPTDNNSEFRVVLVRHSSTTNRSEKDDNQDGIRWWQPISMRPWAKAVITLYLLLLIGALEFFYQTSKQHDGLTNVETESYVRYTWAYVPAAAMLTAQILVGMIGDSSRIFFPYHELRRKLDYTTENLFQDPLSNVTVHAIYSAIRLKQYALLATGLSMLLTPFLTIVSSGLFSPEPTTRVYDSIFRIDNILNTSINLPSTMVETALGFQSKFNLELIVTNNLSYPEWTYGELAFHKMTIDKIKDTDKDLNALYPDPSGLMVQATVPAVRATLDCTYVAPEHVYISHETPDFNSFITIHTDEAAQLSLPNECRSHTLNLTLGDNSHVSQPFAWFGSDGGIYDMDCSSLVAAFGSSLRNGSAQTMACVPVVEQVQTDTTFSLPSYQIVAATTNDTTAVPIANMTAAMFIDMFLPPGPFSGDTSATDGGSYDNTFKILLGAPGFATLEVDDFDAANAAYPKIAAALQHLFRLSYVQGLNLNARSNVPANVSTVASGNISMPTVLEGQIVDTRSQMRLKQSAVSTRILEGLLGAIVVCLLVSFWLLDTKRVMPENACSIAVAASLIAGAEMLREVPRGAEWWNDEEAAKKEVFGKDAVLSLGWWGVEDQDRKTGDREEDTGDVVERDGSGEVRGMIRRRFGIDRGRASWD